MAENVIELNGKRYDALTGAYLGSDKGESYKPAVASTAVKTPKKPSGKHIDGFIRPGGAKPLTTTVTKPKAADLTASKPVYSTPKKPVMAGDVHKKIAASPAVPRPKKPVAAITASQATPVAAKKPLKKISVTNTKANTAKAHSPQHATTLMRHVVKKPLTSIKPSIKTVAPVGIAPVDPSSILFKPSVTRVDEARLKRAKAIAKYSGIRHFMPTKSDYTPSAAAEVAPRHFNSDFHTDVPIIAVRPVPAYAHGKITAHKPKPQHTDIFEAAIARADSHRQPKHPAKRSAHRRLINTMAGIAAFLVIGGFITYLNIPNIKLRVASIQAGFKAEMPEYQPTGYALQGGVQRSGNTVSLHFSSGENNFTITQQPSIWNSQTLEENTLALASGKHKTVEASGRTVFIYNGSNAVWVNGGVRYDLTTNTPLSTDDITHLASSL